jgi:predicted DNA-binding transcriptional regulator
MKAINGKLQLVIKSEKVRRFIEFEVPLMTSRGKVGVEKKRAIVYDYVLDETQKLALNEARELARERGLALKVTDLSRQGFLRRIVASGMDRIRGHVWSRSNSLLAALDDCRG